jgi:hypothetical protein
MFVHIYVTIYKWYKMYILRQGNNSPGIAPDAITIQSTQSSITIGKRPRIIGKGDKRHVQYFITGHKHDDTTYGEWITTGNQRAITVSKYNKVVAHSCTLSDDDEEGPVRRIINHKTARWVV